MLMNMTKFAALLPCPAVLLSLAAVFAAPTAVFAQSHGAGILKNPIGPSGLPKAHVGDVVVTPIRVINFDSFGDSITVTNIVDVVHHASGNATSANLLSSPVTLTNYFEWVDVLHQYVVLPSDPDYLLDDGSAKGLDNHDGPGGSGVRSSFLISISGQLQILRPLLSAQLAVTVNGGLINAVGSISNSGNALLQNVFASNLVNGAFVYVLGPTNIDVGQAISFGSSYPGTSPATVTLLALGTDELGLTVSNSVTAVGASAPLAVFHFDNPSYSVSEDAGTVLVTVTNESPTGGSVNFTTVDVTAQSGSIGVQDYERQQGTLVFANGERAKTITIAILDDCLYEADETFEVRLSFPGPGAMIASPSVATITIIDNDAGVSSNSLLCVFFPGEPPVTAGRLRVTIVPPEAEGQWRFPWELGWRPSGVIVGGLESGSYDLEFRAAPGYQPFSKLLQTTVLANKRTEVTNDYVGSGQGFGSLTVELGPNIVAVDAGWRFLGEEAWRPPGLPVSNLVADIQFIEFKPINGWAPPPPRGVQIFPNESGIISEQYSLAAPLPAGVALPAPLLSFTDIHDGLNHVPPLPYTFNGQLRSSLGFGSGVAVRENVVLTAAHLVFDDETLSYVDEVFWFFQRQAGEYEPKPHRARGFYSFTSYAAARTNDVQAGYSVDQSSPASRNSDAAAIYFLDQIARGGYGGYLVSHSVPSEWLVSSKQKLLVGYPMDGASFGDAAIAPGQMHATIEKNFSFIQSNQVCVTSGFLGFPGNSGGPVYVLTTNLAGGDFYYPAGIYLGSVGNQSVVRVIDLAVADLINRAANYGDTGTNFVSGGLIRIISGLGASQFCSGWVEVHLGPPEAISNGAAWRVSQVYTQYSAFTNFTSAATRIPVQSGDFAIEFRPIPIFALPTNDVVQIACDQGSAIAATYRSPRLFWTDRTNLAMIGAASNRFRIDYQTSLAPANGWIALMTNSLTNPLANGLYPIPVPVATNSGRRFYRAVWQQ